MDNKLRGTIAAARLRAEVRGWSTSETIALAILGSDWLREGKAEAWDEGHRLTAPHSDSCEPTCPNPYRD